MEINFSAEIIGERIRTAREKNKLTNAQLAKSLDVTHSSVSTWECGRAYPSTKNLFLLAQTLGVSAGYLLGLEK